MQGLQIQLVVALDRHEAHRGPTHSFRDRLRIDIVILVGLTASRTAQASDAPRAPALGAPGPKCEPPQDSMPITWIFRFAVKRSSCAREKSVCARLPLRVRSDLPGEKSSCRDQCRSYVCSWDVSFAVLRLSSFCQNEVAEVFPESLSGGAARRSPNRAVEPGTRRTRFPVVSP
jgi:hypothetical protein